MNQPITTHETDLLEAAGLKQRPSTRKAIWLSLRRSPVAIFSLVALVVIVTVALTAPLLPLQAPDQVKLVNRLNPPGYVDRDGMRHFLGTDHLGS